MAFLDDPYHLLRTPLARVTLELVTGVETYAGSSANLKKSIFNYEGGSPPLGVADLGPEVWRGDRPPQQRGFVAVGIPIATPEYFRAWGTERLETETALLRPRLLDLQCPWLLSCFRAAPRANHAFSTISPNEDAAKGATCRLVWAWHASKHQPFQHTLGCNNRGSAWHISKHQPVIDTVVHPCSVSMGHS